MDSGGTFTAGTKAGGYETAVKVEVTQGTISRAATAKVTLDPGSLDHVFLGPAAPTVEVAQVQQFTATALDRFENPIPGLTYTFGSGDQAGRVDSQGKFSAGTKAGTYEGAVTVEVTQGSVTRTAAADLTIEPAAATGVNFPGATWESRTPVELGMDGAKLDQFAANVGGKGVVVKDGYIVKSWGDQTEKSQWHSAGKPVVATTLMFAIQEEKIPSVDTLLTDLGWNMSPKDQAVTIRHLANMMSGYTRAEAPGAAWAYNDYGIQLYYLSIIHSFNEGTRSFAERADTVMRNPNRLGFLQFEDPGLMTIPWKAGNTFRISTTVRDFARIGWFWLNKGDWNGTQLLPKSYFADYMKPAVPGSLLRTQARDPAGDYLGIGSSGGRSDLIPFGPGIYGFNWWYNANGGTTNNLAWPDAPTDLIVANGSLDRELMVISPSLNLVAAAQGDWGTFDPGNPNARMNLNFKLLKEAAIPSDVTPPSSP